MKMGHIDESGIMYVPIEAHSMISNYIISKGDIYISVAGTLGIVGKIPDYLDGANLTENANRVTNIKECNRDYLMYYMMSPIIQNIIENERTVGAQPKLALQRIRHFMIALPSKKEQNAIATALSDIDSLISALSKKIEKKKAIKQGLMQQLLTGKKRLPGFSGEWVEKTIDDTFYCMDNLRVPLNDKQRKKGIYPYCGANGIVDYIDDFCIDDNIILIAEDGGNFADFRTKPIAYKISGKIWVNNHAHILKAKEGWSQDFLFYHLSHKDITDTIVGGTRTKLNKKAMLDILLYIPPTLSEQTAIASILSDCDKDISSLQSKLGKYKELKQGMMQQLLTGNIRLI